MSREAAPSPALKRWTAQLAEKAALGGGPQAEGRGSPTPSLATQGEALSSACRPGSARGTGWASGHGLPSGLGSTRDPGSSETEHVKCHEEGRTKTPGLAPSLATPRPTAQGSLSLQLAVPALRLRAVSDGHVGIGDDPHQDRGCAPRARHGHPQPSGSRLQERTRTKRTL